MWTDQHVLPSAVYDFVRESTIRRARTLLFFVFLIISRILFFVACIVIVVFLGFCFILFSFFFNIEGFSPLPFSKLVCVCVYVEWLISN